MCYQERVRFSLTRKPGPGNRYEREILSRLNRHSYLPKSKYEAARARPVVFRSSLLGEQSQQVNLAGDRLVEVAQVKRLVLGVRVRVRILDTYEQRRDTPECARERIHERDRAAAAHHERFLTVTELQCSPGFIEHRPGRLGHPPARVLLSLEFNRHSPWHLLLQMIE